MNLSADKPSLTDTVFAPAVWLMARLSYFYKSALLFVAVVILLFGTVYIYVDHLESDIVQSRQKLLGVSINKELFDLLYMAERFREQGYLCLQGGCTIKDPVLLRRQLENHLSSIDTLIQAETYHAALEPILETLADNIGKSYKAIVLDDATLYFQQMSDVVENIIALMDQINIRSILLEEQNIEIFLGIQAVFDRLPRISALTGELRGLCSGTLQKGSIDPFLYGRVIDIMGAVEINRVELVSRIQKLIETDPEMQNAVEAIVNSLRTYDNWIERDIIEYQMSSEPQHFFDKGSEVLAKQKALFNLILPRLNNEINTLIHSTQRKKNLIMDTLLIASLLWLYLFIGSYIAVRRSIDTLIEVTDEVASGHLKARMPEQTSEEFNHIAFSMNHMINSLHNRQSLLNSYKNALDDATLVCKADIEGNISYINRAYEVLCGYRMDEVIGKSNAIFHSKNTSDFQIETLWKTILSKQVYHGIFENIAKDGSSFFVKSTIVPILDENENITEFMSIMSDITTLVAHEKELEVRLYTDDLTGLPNRIALHEAIANVKDAKLLLFDIDSLSTVNTIYGENVGDEVLIQLGRTLTKLIAGSTLQLFHLASDEFAILADGSVDDLHFQEDVVMLAHFLSPVKLQCFAHEITIRVSIGAVIASRNDNRRPLIAMASIALKEAKKSSRSYFYYSDITDSSRQIEDNLATIERLDYAIKNGTINCYYQPIYNVHTERVEKFEGLMRVIGPDDKTYSPNTFINVAKGARLYGKLTEQVVLNTLAIAELNPEIVFSINIDVEDINDTHTAAFILDQLHRSTSAERIVFELVESEKIDNNDLVKSFLAQLKRLGCQIAIDDFGSGYSNYAYMLEMGIDLIKIDGSLIVNIDKDKDKQRIVSSIISIAHDLGMETVAEYVNSHAVYEMVVFLGTDYVQGIYIAAAAEELRFGNGNL